MALIDMEAVSSVDLPELLAASRVLVEEVASRVSSPDLLEYLDRFPEEPEVDRSGRWGLYAHADGTGTGTGADAHTDAGTDSHTDAGTDSHTDAGTDSHTGDVGPDATFAEDAAPAGSLPIILAQVEGLGRMLEAARTGLAGHTERIFDSHTTRREVLGVPEGKTAYRNGADYLRQTLRIHRVEAKKRVARAGWVLARRDPSSLQLGAVVAPVMPVLAQAVADAVVDPASVDTVAGTLAEAGRDAVLAGADPDLVEGLVTEGERILVGHACQSDPETVKKVCAHWHQRFDALVNPDGLEPTEAQANAAQGLFYQGRGKANLHRWLLMATDAQHEILRTVAADAANPRKDRASSTCAAEERSPAGAHGAHGNDGNDGNDGPDGTHGNDGPDGTVPSGDDNADAGSRAGSNAGLWADHVRKMEILDPRNRAQQQLDGLVSALTGALALTSAPDPTGGADGAGRPDVGGGGARPQVLVTIDYQTLTGQYLNHQASSPPANTGRLISRAAYAGPVNPAMIRQLACDGELIPVVLGGKGEVLDVGRSRRLFTRKLRRAITARDGGCAAPDCSIPAPWCEAHHIQHWEHGGPTSVDNGVLLCSHHHHAVHAGAWDIEVVDGIPWFIPAGYHDPTRTPRRNHYWRTTATNPGDGERHPGGHGGHGSHGSHGDGGNDGIDGDGGNGGNGCNEEDAHRRDAA